MTTATRTYNNTEYIVSGSDPKFLVLSGMHGDEHEVVDCQKKYIEANQKNLPPFVFIPQASPSAIALKTRTNKEGHDINRTFIDPPMDQEAAAIIHILSTHQFDFCINIHEDPDRTNSFYLYDTEIMKPNDLQRFREAMLKTGTALFNGIDDLEDISLGFQVVDGYISTPVEETFDTSGFLSGWLIRHNIAKRVLVPEIPGKASIAQKQKLVNAILDFFLHQ
jgi:hypothetical protein